MIRKAFQSPRWTLLAFAIGHVAIFAGLFRGVYSMPFSGTGLFYEYAGRILAGQLPYRDFVAEYPPLALVFFTLPRLAGESFRWYYVWFQVEVVAFDLLVVATLHVTTQRWRQSPARVLGVYTLAVLAVGPIMLQQFDVMPAAFTLLTVLAYSAGRRSTSAVLLGLGVMTKLYPILLAPLLVIAEVRRERVKGLWMPLGAFAATCALCVTPWLRSGVGSLSVLVAYHTKRGIHLDSVYGSIALLIDQFGLAPVRMDFSFASWNVVGPAVGLLVRASTIALVLGVVAAYALFDRQARRDPAAVERSPAFLGHAAALVVATAIVTSKVLSPQYLVWLAPLLPLVLEPRRGLVLTVFTVAGVLTYFMYPLHYEALLAARTYAVGVMALRNAALILLAVVLAQSFSFVHPNSTSRNF